VAEPEGPTPPVPTVVVPSTKVTVPVGAGPTAVTLATTVTRADRLLEGWIRRVVVVGARATRV
jgi:hypothetical protein